MELILLEKIAGLGELGDKVSVKAGYGRNFLIPSANRSHAKLSKSNAPITDCSASRDFGASFTRFISSI